MDSEAFLSRVVATRDNVVVSVLKAGGAFWNARNCTTVQEAAKHIATFDANPELTVYFAVGTHKDNEEQVGGKTKIYRKQSTAAWFKALALDLDCGPGKPYPTKKEGFSALCAALKQFDFPPPLVVDSGNGVHCYWPLETEIQAPEWVRLSTALRCALAEFGVELDWSKIHDSSMVLRPAGTHNKKQTPFKEVKVLLNVPDYAVAELEGKLTKWMTQIPSKKSITGTSSRSAQKQTSSIADVILKGSFEPLNLPIVSSQCPQLAALVASGGATDAMGKPVCEPLWRLSLGVAYYCTDKQQAVMDLCSKHPDFDLGQNMDKLDNWKGSGVTTCSSFENECPGGCAACMHKGEINSPAALNRTTELHVVRVDRQTGEQEPIGITALPPGYFAGNWKIWTEVEGEKKVPKNEATGEAAKTVMVTERVKVSDYPIVVLDRYADSDCREKSTMIWAVGFPIEGWKIFEMPIEVLTGSINDIGKFFGNKQLFVKDEALLQRTRRYLLSYLSYIQNNRATGVDIASYGWQLNGAFLCGTTMLSVDGSLAQWRASRKLKLLNDKVCSRGDRQVWADHTKIYDKPSASYIAFSLMVAGSGLLLQGSNISPMVYSLCSTETGTGKSFGLLVGNSLFGHPSKLLLTHNDTDNAMFQHMGMLGSLSASVDELTAMGEERAVALAFQAQTGREKLSLNSSREMREGVQWHAPLRVSTNKSLHAMYDAYKSKAEAEKVRTFEALIDDRDFVNQVDMHELIRLILDNHGFGAAEIAGEIQKRGGVRVVYDYFAKEFEAKFKFEFLGEERFYKAHVIASYGVGVIGHELGLFQFDIERATLWALEWVLIMRVKRLNNITDAFDLIGQFITESNEEMVVGKQDAGNSGKLVVQMPIPSSAVARVEIIFDSKNQVLPGSKLMISTMALKTWARRHREDIDAMIKSLKRSGAVTDEKARVSLYKGTHHNNPGQAQCVVLDLTHPRFASTITSAKAIVSTNPALAVLQGGKT